MYASGRECTPLRGTVTGQHSSRRPGTGIIPAFMPQKPARTFTVQIRDGNEGGQHVSLQTTQTPVCSVSSAPELKKVDEFAGILLHGFASTNSMNCLGFHPAVAGRSRGGVALELCHGPGARNGARRRVLERRKCGAMKFALVIKIKDSSTSSAYKCLRPWPSLSKLQEEGFKSSRPVGSKWCTFTKHDHQKRLRLPFDIPCCEDGADYFSSGESYADSDGEGSSGASPRSEYSSGSGSESERDVFFEFFDENDTSDAKRIDFVSPLMKSSVLYKRSFPSRVGQGILVSAFLSLVLAGTVLTVDSYIWKVIRRPLAHYFLTVPFCLAAAASTYFGTICVPWLKRLKAHQVFRMEGPAAHQSKVGTPTMGGLYFVPIGVGVARLVTGSWPQELWGVCVATLAFAAIGFLDDWLALWRKHNYGMPGSLKFLLQVAVGVWFVFWLDNARLQSPYKMKRLVPLPDPFGLRYMGKWYLPLTTFCFAAMSNGVNLTDGLDGLAAGTSAAAYIGMAVAVLPIYPGLGIFGASMAGACIGFLTQNKYKARVFMGDTGSLALGGGLAAMAACTGMFLPLFIASGVFIIETVSVILQVSFFKLTKRFEGKGRRLLRMAPFHHHLELLGWEEPIIIAAAYAVAFILAMAAAHTGLISA